MLIAAATVTVQQNQPDDRTWWRSPARIVEPPEIRKTTSCRACAPPIAWDAIGGIEPAQRCRERFTRIMEQ
jgi:hypothetical protein